MPPIKYVSKITIRSEHRASTGAIFITLTSRGKRIRIGLGRNVDARFWDSVNRQVKPQHPMASAINTLMRKKMLDIDRVISEYQLKGVTPSLALIKAIAEGGGNEQTVISAYIRNLADQMKGRLAPGTIVHYHQEAARLDQYHEGVRFDQIDNNWLKDYEAHLRSRHYSHNTVHKVFKKLQTFFNAALRDGVTSNDPFRKFKKPSYRQTDRTWLTAIEVDRIEAMLQFPMDDRIRRAATWLLFGCYSGLRFSDWQRFNASMIRGDSLILRAQKNGELVIMPLHTRLSRIIAELPNVGPVEAEPNTNKFLKDVAKLAGVKKNLTTHVGRHTFAVRCAELGISIETCAELMGISVKTCQVYYKVTGIKVRKEMDRWG